MNNNSQAEQLKKEILVRLVKAFLTDNFVENVRLIPYDMRPKGSEVPYRCCIYKERAILKDRCIAGLGISIEEDDETTLLSSYAQRALDRIKPEKDHLTVLDAACKGCVPSRIYVTELCQGCVARPCQSSCKFGAITIVNGKSVIDGTKCKNCQMCVTTCPYNAIVKLVIPCEEACPVGAIRNENGHAKINFDICINCGKCIDACPFAAVHEKSQLVDILKNIKLGKNIIAMIAPSIAGQFPGTVGQHKAAIKKIGFTDVYEVAQGADITIKNEAKEFKERIDNGEQFMTTSCCAGYNQLIKKHLPQLKPFVSTTQTPLYYTAEIVKNEIPDAITVFISPCVAKRTEVMENPNIDYVLNYEELDALFIAKKIEILDCEEESFKINSSKQARNFGESGGVTKAVQEALKEKENINPCIISGLNKDSIRLLKKCAKNGCTPDGTNLIEVMCCNGGCIQGNATINNSPNAYKIFNEYVEQGTNIEQL